MSNQTFIGAALREAGAGCIYGAAGGFFGGATVYGIGEIVATAVLKVSVTGQIGSVVGAIAWEGNKINVHDRNLIISRYTLVGAALGGVAKLTTFVFLKTIDLLEYIIERVSSLSLDCFNSFFFPTYSK